MLTWTVRRTVGAKKSGRNAIMVTYNFLPALLTAERLKTPIQLRSRFGSAGLCGAPLSAVVPAPAGPPDPSSGAATLGLPAPPLSPPAGLDTYPPDRRAFSRPPRPRRGGRVVDRTALEMRHTGNRIGGSNPSLSAINALNSISGSADMNALRHST
jgi:hypothetical protein